jgi:hypothetical protein
MSQDLAELARSIVDANLYMTLGTADRDGRPWVSPVYFASADYIDFYWISDPESTHSRNLAARAQASIVIFDSQVRPGSGNAVYMSAQASELSGPELDRGLAIYPGARDRGARNVTRDQVTQPAPYRIYRATVSEHSVLCPSDAGQTCPVHRVATDHRASVALIGHQTRDRPGPSTGATGPPEVRR